MIRLAPPFHHQCIAYVYSFSYWINKFRDISTEDLLTHYIYSVLITSCPNIILEYSVFYLTWPVMLSTRYLSLFKTTVIVDLPTDSAKSEHA